MRAFTTILSAWVLAGLTAGMAHAVNIPTVPVGNPGNGGDNEYGGYGSVSYAYNIGKYEVTAGQYAEFLNQVGGVDTHALYHPGMADTTWGCGITRAGDGTAASPYTYGVVSGFANRPVSAVSFWDACRFANWLHNGQPAGAQGAGTTETGAYTMTTDGIANNTIVRNADWTWAVASENEWYKAAYHKNNGVTADYWYYPTGDYVDVSMANYSSDTYVGHTTDVGTYPYASAYGTYDQIGNLREWNETVVQVSAGSSRGVRGGAWCDDMSDHAPLKYIRDSYLLPGEEGNYVGFRVSQVPEPASALLLAVAAAALTGSRKGKRPKAICADD